MRCNNCGWNNPEGVLKCQKCNQPLVSETIPMIKSSGITENSVVNYCPNCGYLITEGTGVCPACKTVIQMNTNEEEQKIEKKERNVLQSSQQTVVLDDITKNSGENHIMNKHTVMDVNSDRMNEGSRKQEKNVALKKTVFDLADSNKVYSQLEKASESELMQDSNASEESSSVDTSNNSGEFCYAFECMDSDEHDVINLVSNTELFLKEDEVILISGLRFRRK